MKKLALTLPRTATTYFLLFTVGAIAFELVRFLTPTRSNATILLCVTIIGILTLVGVFFLNDRHLLSRTVSAATLFALGFIGLSFEAWSIYLLPLALGISYLGTRPLFHKKPQSTLRSILLSVGVVVLAMLFVVALFYGLTLIRHVVLTSNFYNYK